VFVHSNIRLEFGWLQYLLATPRFHHWHHGIEKEAINVNYAVHFAMLDYIFGTWHFPKGIWPEGYGIKNHPVPSGYWQQFLFPFRGASNSDERSGADATEPSGGE